MNAPTSSGPPRGSLGYEDFLNDLAGAGIRAIIEIGATKEDELAALSRLKGHAAIFGWNFADDVHDKRTLDQAKQQVATIRGRDADHITFSAIYDPGKWGPFMEIGDTVGAYRYPIYTDASAISVVASMIGQTANFNVAVFGIPQAYRWAGGSNRFPTPAEYRNMTYQYVLVGVQGLLPYTFRGEGFTPEGNATLWNEVKAVNLEVKAVRSMLLGGSLQRISGAGSGVVAGAWSSNAARLLIVLTTSSSNTNVGFDLPSGVEGTKLTSVFSDRPSGLSLSGRRVSGTLQGLAVHVYRVE